MTTANPLPTTESGRPAATRSPVWTLVLVCGATFMLLLDLTIVVVALGTIQADFHARLDDLQWVVDAYTLPLAGFLLTAATLGDRLGRRRIFLAGMVIFTAGSLACALAPNALTLDLTRALQGIGSALLFGSALPLLGSAYPDPRKRAGAIGVFGAVMAAATAVGPLLGGALVQGPGWRWIFLINVPIGLATLVIGHRRLAESRAAAPRRADWPGTGLLSAGLLALVLGLIRGNSDGWGSVPVVGLFVAAGLLLICFVVREATARQPMLDLGLFRSRSFTGVAVSGFAVSVTLVAATNYLALYIQNTLGFDALQSGLRFLPLTVASFLAAPTAARLGHRIPVRLTVGASLVLVGLGMLLAGRLDGSSRWTELVAGFVVAGVGLGVSSAALPQAALGSVEPGRAGMATGAANTMRQIGVAAGVAILGALFEHQVAARAYDRLAAAGLPASPSGRASDAMGAGAGVRVAEAAPAPLRGVLAATARVATAHGIDVVLLVGGIGAIVAGIAAFVLIGSRRADEPAGPADGPAGESAAGSARGSGGPPSETFAGGSAVSSAGSSAGGSAGSAGSSAGSASCSAGSASSGRSEPEREPQTVGVP